ncbi:heavy metal sensor histidine kinase [Pseudomonas sp. COW5]|uniref:heavy metal sensor histidine kinase n=1 Tax=Pseudomonas sp. COW5 TaxID=2981253 RepID=UPI002245966D|nr:heavy metal sensor histidine kinase [Pseudomonas sp. COW5]MCX2545783.1 heavy metal sensor histidine kinase [Pseudomonas sp. COW5]
MKVAGSYSLTLRLALVFAVLAFASLAGLGAALYNALDEQLTRRDDIQLVSRIDQLRTILNDSNTLELIQNKPALFQNMLGNREALLTIGAPDQPPLFVVNPSNLTLPTVPAVPINHVMALNDVQHLPSINGVPFSAVAASIDSGDQGNLQVLIGKVMSERTAMLASYRLSVYGLASLAAIVLALVGCLLVYRGLLPLRRLARHAHGIGIANLGERLDHHGTPRELQPMIEAFNAMLDRLDRGVTQLSQVSTDMAHELRTPINNLLGETQVALQQNRSVEAYQQLLASNVEELERLARMLDNMLFLARTDPASALSQRQELDADDEMQRIADYFEGLAADVGVTIEARGSGVIWAEPMLLRRALANLCANAIKYGAADSTMQVEAISEPDGSYLRVRNHGATIPPEHLSRLFERFYRADPSRERSAQSNGLGLSIVATIMQLHQGRYSVSSADGVTCFELFFPARETRDAGV